MATLNRRRSRCGGLHSGSRFVRGFHRGFTLVEILVVMVILAVVVSMLVPSLSGSRARDVRDAADRMVMLVNLAQQEAILSSRTWRLAVDPVRNEYAFTQRVDDEFEAPTGAPFSRPQALAGVVFGELRVNDEDAKTGSEIFLLPTGERDSFSVEMRAGDFRREIVMPPFGPAHVASSSPDQTSGIQ